jgi:hypothetical protein
VTLAIQIAIVLYIAVAAIATWLLWNNAAAPDAVKNLGIGFASLLPLLVSILPYLNQEKLEKEFAVVLVHDRIDKGISEGTGPYLDSYLNMFANLSQSTKHTKIEDIDDFTEAGFDIIEKGIVESLSSPAQLFWEGGPRSRIIETKTPTVSRILSMDEVREKFRHNSLITMPGILVSKYWSLPPKSRLSVTQRRFARIIAITNPYGTLTVSIRNPSGRAASEVWGIAERDSKNELRYFHLTYLLSCTFVPARFKNYEKMASYKRWYENISEVLAEFDWKNVEAKMERYRTREAISKLSEKR